MSAPTRATTAGRAYLDLRKLARENRRPVDELLQLYVLEAFLARLSGSEFVERLVLKGGVLLASFGERRPTRDIDLQAQALENDVETIRATVCEIAAIALNDGAIFDIDSATAELIRDEEAYTGVRVNMTARLATARHHFRVDVNVGDPISPAPELVRSTCRVARHRQVQLTPLVDVLAGYGEIGQQRWAAWRRRQRLEDRLPEQFDEVLSAVIDFADPAITGSAEGRSWDPAASPGSSRTWVGGVVPGLGSPVAALSRARYRSPRVG